MTDQQQKPYFSIPVRAIFLTLAICGSGCATTPGEEDDEVITSAESADAPENSGQADGHNAAGADPDLVSDEESEESEESEEEYEAFAGQSGEEEEVAEEIPETVDFSLVSDCSDPDCKEATGSTSAVGGKPAVEDWKPVNDSPAPAPTNQQDLRLVCKQMGPGLESGFRRYGCNSVRKNDGHHYGIVKGWWEIKRGDGVRAKSRSLNFREGGFDMAFDVLESDAGYGIKVIPGTGKKQ